MSQILSWDFFSHNGHLVCCYSQSSRKWVFWAGQADLASGLASGLASVILWVGLRGDEQLVSWGRRLIRPRLQATHLNEVLALGVDGRKPHRGRGGVLFQWASLAEAALFLLVAGVRLLGMALSLSQFMKLPSLLDQGSTVVLALLPQRGRYPQVPGTVGERRHLQWVIGYPVKRSTY